MTLTDDFRIHVIKPRVKGFTHRKILAIAGGKGLTDSYEMVDDVPSYLLSERNSPHMIFTSSPEYLLQYCMNRYKDSDIINVRYNISDNEAEGARFSEAKVSRILVEYEDGKNRIMHSIFDPSRAFGLSRIEQWQHYSSIQSLLELGIDVRDWCESQNLPFGQSFPAIASSLSRDGRFWPENRRPVPRATNDRVRKALPGVYQVRNHPRGKVIEEGVAVDQIRSFHKIVQTVGVPDRETLFARGYFGNPEDCTRVWAPYGSDTYRNVTLDSFGLVAAVLRRRRRSVKFASPITLSISHSKSYCMRYVWTNELHDLENEGIEILGLTAAWTAESTDKGFAKYGEYAEQQILDANAFRKEWLKPCLHCIYGLMGARDRKFTISSNNTDRGKRVTKNISGFNFECNEVRVKHGPSLANVAVLGILQSESRRRSLMLANRYADRVTHIHADGVHLIGPEVPNLSDIWSAERITNLVYLDDVSYISDEKDILPGRYGKDRVESRRRAIASVNRERKARRRTKNLSPQR